LADLDLIDWTIQEAQHLKVERRESRDLDGAPLLDKLLAVLEREPLGSTNSEVAVAQIANAPSIQTVIEEPIRPSGDSVAVPKRESDLAVPTGPSTSTTVRAEEPKSALLMAVVAPDIYTARLDRDRAVAVRWVLRDIQSKRLKWWPVNQHELRRLIEMGLVEMRDDDAPVLTDLGTSAII
jgi:hypothetical protein